MLITTEMLLTFCTIVNPTPQENYSPVEQAGKPVFENSARC
ncbi:hypothetical protein [Phormidium nigroviride]|nr:hypothetical protein [Oscillatoria nigro-viridis]